jgi:hypothetical protein
MRLQDYTVARLRTPQSEQITALETSKLKHSEGV